MDDSVPVDAWLRERHYSRNRADTFADQAAAAATRVASVTSPRMTRAAHRSHSIVDSTRRRPTMVPSSNCAQFPEPRTFGSPGRTWSKRPVLAQKIESYSVSASSVIVTSTVILQSRGRHASFVRALASWRRITSLPLTGIALSSTLRPLPSLCGHATPILVQLAFSVPSRGAKRYRHRSRIHMSQGIQWLLSRWSAAIDTFAVYGRRRKLSLSRKRE